MLFKAPRKTNMEVYISTQYRNSRGKQCFAGGQDLKASQKYPRGFGEAVQNLFDMRQEDINRHLVNLERQAKSIRVTKDDVFGAVEDEWADADLQPIFNILNN